MPPKSKPERDELNQNLNAYLEKRAELEAAHRGEYVAVAGGQVVGVYPDFEAACLAVEQYQKKLVFEIGTLPTLSPLRLSGPIGRVGTIRLHGG